MCSDSGREFWRVAVELLFQSRAIGVGHNPDPLAQVSGTNGGSRYAMPDRIEPERGQVSKNDSETPKSESIDVFHDRVSGS